MKTEILGRTGLEIPIVGLGTGFIGIADPNRAAAEYDFMDTWTVEPPGPSGVVSGKSSQMDVELGIATVHAAIEAGSTLIDTAPLYGSGNSESIIGEALRQRPDLAKRCTVTTKVGQTADGRDYSYDAVMRQVEESRRRLGIDGFDVLYIHDAMEIPVEEVMGRRRALGALRRLQDTGVTRFVGTAANDPCTNASYIETGEFDAAVVPDALSLINQLAGERILPAAVTHNVGLVVATPVERGLLATGPVHQLPGPKFQPVLRGSRLENPDSLRQTRGTHGCGSPSVVHAPSPGGRHHTRRPYPGRGPCERRCRSGRNTRSVLDGTRLAHPPL